MIKKFLKLFGIFLVFILLAKFIYSQGWYQINITNSQSQATPAPFQQDIAICNGSINIGNSFAYINNAALFNEINSNGSNVYFTTTNNSTPNIYSWYEGQLNYNGVTCDVWWINLPNGIPANSNVTIYMYVGPNSANYYSQYYPYVGEAPQLSSTYGQYDNGNYVFNYYWNFNGTSAPSGWTQSLDSVSYNNGVTITGSNSGYWYYTGQTFSGTILIEEMMKVITQASTTNYGEGAVGITTTSPSWVSTFSLTRVLQGSNPLIGYDFYGNQGITSIVFEPVGTFGIIGFYASSSGMAVYSNYQLIQQTSSYTVPSSYYIVGCNADSGAQVFVQWIRVRAYPPNGIMPSIILTLTPNWNTITITNTQSQATPSPFQQDIAICNGSINVSSSFAYINNFNLFNEINSNGSNVYFTTNLGSNPNIYSWYEGQLSINNATCNVWWINIPQGIPANSNITIYMYIGNSSSNYYSQYYPYVGEAPYLSSTYGQYDNGNYVFNYYSNTSNTVGWTISGSAGLTTSPPASSVPSFGSYAFYAYSANGYYIYTQLPSNVPTNNVIIEYYFYTNGLGNLYFYVNSGGAGQMSRAGCGSGWYGIAATSSWTNWDTPGGNGNYCSAWYLVGVTLSGSTATEYITNGNAFYGLEIGQNAYTYSSVSINGNYIGLVGDKAGSSYISYWEGIIIRAYPPNGIMPSIYIG